MSTAGHRAAVGDADGNAVGDAAASVVAIGALDRDDRWVSSAAVRQAIGGWVYSLGVAHRPSDAQVRTALGVAHAIHERASDSVGRRFGGRATGAGERADVVAGAVPVPEDPSDLAERAGIDVREVAAALDLLVSSRAVVRHHGATAPTLALAADLLAPIPAIRRLDWAFARARLRTVGASLPPALAVLRELGSRVGALPPGESPPPVRVSVRDLEEATAFGRSTVGDALAALERAGLVVAEVRAGRTTRFTLRPVLYGLPDAERSPVSELAGGGRHADRAADRARRGAASTIHAVETAPAPAAPAIAASAAAAPSREEPVARRPDPSTIPPGAEQHRATTPIAMTFGGVTVHAPAGTSVALERDDRGRWICRVGPLTLGPIDA